MPLVYVDNENAQFVLNAGTGIGVLTVLPDKTATMESRALVTEETDPTVPSWAKAASKPSYTKSEVGLGNVDNVKQYSASNPPPYPVTSVNGKTGAVTLDASAVGARPSTWTPTAANVGAVPTSRKVNGKALSTDITLSASDVGARASTWMPSASDVGALPSSTKIPAKTSDLTNDSGFQTASQVTAIVQQQLGVIENGSY